MIESEYYQNYQGPNLTKAILNDEEDITEQIRGFYGNNNIPGMFFPTGLESASCVVNTRV